MRAVIPSVLITGFEPFGGETVNPSARVAQALSGRRIAGHRVRHAVLPCAFGQALDALDKALQAYRPRLVLAMGQADGRCEISVERVAINVDDARIADNAGARPIDAPVVAGAPDAYFSTLPIKAIVKGLRAAGHPAGISQSAGTFVCNHVFYGLMHRLAESVAGVRGGFVHLPLLPAQASRRPGSPSLGLDDQVAAIALALEVALSTDVDERRAEGSVA